MASKSTVTVVVSEEQREMFLMMAQERGQSLSAYMRDRLLANDNLEAEFRALQGALIATIHETARQAPATPAPASAQASGGGIDAKAMGLLVEMLLHLRALGNPTKNQSIRAEVARMGFEQFT